MKAWLEAFMRKFILMFARDINNGWATRSPFMTDMFVLSEVRIVPRSVAPAGSVSYTILVRTQNLLAVRGNSPASPRRHRLLSIRQLHGSHLEKSF